MSDDSTNDAPEPTAAEVPPRANDPKPSSTEVARIKQPHGGALLAGGVKGNRGGRSPAALRNTCRNEFAKMLPKIKALTRATRDDDGKVLARPDARTLLRVAELFAKYGLDAAISVSDAKSALRATKAEIDEYLPADQAETLWNRIMSHWVKI